MSAFQAHKSRVCLECGPDAEHHLTVWVQTTGDVVFSAVSKIKIFKPIKFLAHRVEKSFAFVVSTMVTLGVWLKIVSFNNDLDKTCTKRSRVIWAEALQRNIAMRQIIIFGRPTEFFEARLHGRPYFFESIPIPSRYESENWADDKYILKQTFCTHGISTPRMHSVTTFRGALRALDQLGVVCIKPQRGTNGRHTYPYVRTKDELQEAYNSAKKLCYWVVVEEHLEGPLVRATCVDGKLVGFLECQYPTVVGNGVQTVGALVEEKNKTKSAYAKDIVITQPYERFIARRGYTLDSILEKGKHLQLFYWGGFGAGGSNKEYGTDIHPELRAEIERAARTTELPVVGFDVIIEDPHKAPQDQKWGIIEANSLPWIDLHSSPNYDKSINVAAYVWDLWENKIDTAHQN